MKVLPFTIPVPEGQTIIVQEEMQSHFYPHLHRHAEIQITWIKRGEGTLLTGNSMHSFKAGEVYVLGANLPHLFRSSPEYFDESNKLDVQELTIFFDPTGKLSALFDLPEMQAVKTFFEKWQVGFKIPVEVTGAFREQIDMVQHTRGVYRMSVFLRMVNLLMGIENLQPLSVASHTQPLTDPEGMRIASVLNYIMHNYSSTLTLEDVALQAHLTPNAFCRYFKKHTRLTFVAFVNKVRVNQACKLLINGELNTIADIAYSCGFSSINNFNLTFKKIMGKSPRDYVNDYTHRVK
ncbi:helix-turn-helix transcriptional regulator [Mucilaginibacter rigui]|uniref:Helix-turn-helix transcriptional regulator n=1 Tax=Mucilaginibacter rigui TaxID=534635 RepID=A0ABR7X695_9SPHI|nr:AraC family transcriptional regulator [Mucilaginibacter rigui]MBD1386026.1 helix-turn-helix transcriptional regulator [Mucilaginibacter rigui]